MFDLILLNQCESSANAELKHNVRIGVVWVYHQYMMILVVASTRPLTTPGG